MCTVKALERQWWSVGKMLFTLPGAVLSVDTHKSMAFFVTTLFSFSMATGLLIVVLLAEDQLRHQSRNLIDTRMET